MTFEGTAQSGLDPGSGAQLQMYCTIFCLISQDLDYSTLSTIYVTNFGKFFQIFLEHKNVLIYDET